LIRICGPKRQLALQLPKSYISSSASRPHEPHLGGLIRLPSSWSSLHKADFILGTGEGDTGGHIHKSSIRSRRFPRRNLRHRHAGETHWRHVGDAHDEFCHSPQAVAWSGNACPAAASISCGSSTTAANTIPAPAATTAAAAFKTSRRHSKHDGYHYRKQHRQSYELGIQLRSQYCSTSTNTIWAAATNTEDTIERHLFDILECHKHWAAAGTHQQLQWPAPKHFLPIDYLGLTNIICSFDAKAKGHSMV